MYKYKAIRVNGKKVDQHRYIMEQHLNRKLSKYEIVHHKNGDTTDNRLDNLELMSLSDHVRLHNKKRILSNYTKNLISENLKIKSRKGVNHCNSLFTSEVVKEIRNLYKVGYSQRSLARQFACSKSTIQSVVTNNSYKDV